MREIGRVSSGAFTAYEKLLGDEERPGLARELARVVLPLNTYTQWYWKIDLHNLLHFLQLRADAHAQYEIRAYADELMRIVDGWVPLTTRAFRKYRVGGAQLSADALEAVRRRLRGESAQGTRPECRRVARAGHTDPGAGPGFRPRMTIEEQTSRSQVARARGTEGRERGKPVPLCVSDNMRGESSMSAGAGWPVWFKLRE